MSEPLSTHLPFVAGEFVFVIGEALIDTSLREIQAATASFAVEDFVANQEGKISCRVIGTQLIIRVEKTGSNEGVLGTNPVLVSWVAVGK